MSHAFPKLLRPLRFYAVVPTADWVARMVDAGADTVQLRCKDLQGQALAQEIQRCVDYVSGSHTQLFINDHWQYALDAGAYGIHLGQEDMSYADMDLLAKSGIRLGISTHADSELERALSYQPSYVACGAIFPTTTKVMPTKPQGLDRLKHYVAMAHPTPVVAIGGINLDNAQAVLACGADSLAVVRAITESNNPTKTVQAFQQLWKRLPENT